MDDQGGYGSMEPSWNHLIQGSLTNKVKLESNWSNWTWKGTAAIGCDIFALFAGNTPLFQDQFNLSCCWLSCPLWSNIFQTKNIMYLGSQCDFKWKHNPNQLVLSQSFVVYKCKSLLQSVLHLIMGHLSIDCSPHIHFPLMLYVIRAPCICWFERWYYNYHDEAYLAAVSDVPACNTRSTRRPVLWPWWLLTREQSKDEKLSWELVMTRPDIFDLIDLRAHIVAHTNAHTKTWRTKRQGEHQHLTAMDGDSYGPDVGKCVVVIHFFRSWCPPYLLSATTATSLTDNLRMAESLLIRVTNYTNWPYLTISAILCACIEYCF